MFQFTRPTPLAIANQIAAARSLPSTAPRLLSLNHTLGAIPPPSGFVHDQLHSCLGNGARAFQAAKRALETWAPFDLDWVRVANPEAAIAPGQVVAVEVHTVGLWTLNLSRIIETIDAPSRFGFIYATTSMHVEQGEERFLLEFDDASGDVSYDIEAVSRPRNTLARLAFPISRTFQHRFARDSHRRMRVEHLAEK